MKSKGLLFSTGSPVGVIVGAVVGAVAVVIFLLVAIAIVTHVLRVRRCFLFS